MRIGIRSKFLLLITALLLVIFGTITVFQIRSTTTALRNDLFDESRAFASLATEPIGNTFAIYKDSGTSKIDQQVDEFTTLNDNVTNVQIVDVTGKTVYSRSGEGQEVSQAQAEAFEPIFHDNQDGTLDAIIYPYFEASGAHRFTIVYSISDDAIASAIRSQTLQLLYFGLASLAFTLALVYLLINHLIIKPIQQVSEQAMLISAGKLEQQIQVRGHDEIASLGESVNKMAESLKANIAELQEVDKVKSEFMMITSHNLRTPLTIINGYLESMDLIIGDADKLMEALKRIGASVKRLETFAEDVLTISRFELGDAQLQSGTVKVKDFMERIISEFKATTEIKKLNLVTDIQDADVELRISAPYIHSAVWNILDNAAKFTKEGGTITLSSKRENNYLLITVKDTGIGISDAELPKLFTKFHRGTSTLTYDFEGTGIGLYASKVMVEKHGGTITVASKEGVGSSFTIHLPIN